MDFLYKKNIDIHISETSGNCIDHDGLVSRCDAF